VNPHPSIHQGIKGERAELASYSKVFA
jgi:hypothetical protein